MSRTAADIPDLADVRATTLSRAGARIDHLYHALVRRRFAGVVRRLGRYVPQGGVVLDVGANHGRFAKHLAALHRGSCHVYCFEPLEYNLRILRLVVGRRPNVTIVERALSDEDGVTELFVPYKKASRRFTHGSAHMADTSTGATLGTRTAPDVCRAEIRTVRLDDWARGSALDRLDLIKIDVEGAEPLVIAGGLETIERFKPAIYAELIPGMPERLGRSVDDVVEPLRTLGYHLYASGERATERRIDAVSPDVRDYLFLHPASENAPASA